MKERVLPVLQHNCSYSLQCVPGKMGTLHVCRVCVYVCSTQLNASVIIPPPIYLAMPKTHRAVCNLQVGSANAGEMYFYPNNCVVTV